MMTSDISSATQFIFIIAQDTKVPDFGEFTKIDEMCLHNPGGQ